MTIAMLSRLIEARLVQADLLAADSHFTANGLTGMEGVLNLKTALTSLSNLTDLERSIRPLYEKNRSLSTSFSNIRPELEFAQYMRNKGVGHLKDALLEKAIEWRPEFHWLVDEMDVQSIMVVSNLFMLETAINTYVREDGSHKYFESETDLMHPPDWERFLGYLEMAIRGALDYLAELIDVLRAECADEIKDPKEVDVWVAAGLTEFKYLRKSS